MVRGLGYRDPVHDAAWGFTTTDYMQHLQTTRQPGRWENLRPGQPPGVVFWFRQAPVALVSDSLLQSGRATFNIPSHYAAGHGQRAVDLKGRLHTSRRTCRGYATPRSRDRFDWKVVLDAAGFDQSTLTRARPVVDPPGFADARAAWDGVYPDRPEVKIHIEAAAAHGRPVYFQIFEPWSPQTLAPPTGPTGVSPMVIAGILGLLLVASGAVALVRRNVRLSRGDRAGAVHVAATLAILVMVAGLLTAHQSFGLNGTLATILVLFARGTLVGLAAYTFYMALEPDVRRRSPETLVSWSRAIDGRLRDPLVGRDLLIGIAVGGLLQLLTQGAHLAPAWFGHGPSLSTPLAGYDGTVGFVVAVLITHFVSSVLIATSLALVYLMLYLMIRRRRFTTAAYVVVLFGIAATIQGPSVTLAFSAVAIGLIVFTLLAAWPVDAGGRPDRDRVARIRSR